MAPRPTISVLIPTYNRAQLLSRTLSSVFAQTVHVDDVVLVDDGSTDDTADAVQSLLSRHPSWRARFRYLRQQNQGKSVALNAALKVARGEYLAFLDSDDVWRLDKLEWQLRALSRFPECGVCFTDSVPSHRPDLSGKEFQEGRSRHPECFPPTDGPVGKVQDPSRLFCGGWPGVYMQSVLVREATMRRCGGFDPLLRLGQDMDFLFRLGLLTPFCYVALPLLEVHRDPERALGLITEYAPTSLPRLYAERARMCKWLQLIGDSAPGLGRAIRHDMASVSSALANRYRAAREPSSARRVLRVGMRECFEWRLLAKYIMTYGWGFSRSLPGFFSTIVAGPAAREDGWK